VGKSSLLNALTGAHLAIVSPKAQATRLPVAGLVTTGDTQFVFHDLPGLLDPRYALHRRMREAALAALERMDLVLHLHPASEAPAPAFQTLTGIADPPDRPLLTVYTKADLLPAAPGISGLPPGALSVSTEWPDSLPALLEAIRSYLPERAFEYDADNVGVQPIRFFATEYVREAAFLHLEDELPYAVAAIVEEFREDATPVYIRVSLYVERDSQKGIVIGRGGQTLKAIGMHARARLEALLGAPVYLECRVKVLANWRRQESTLDYLGFPRPRNTR
jgi:GTP-binding protein Era